MICTLKKVLNFEDTVKTRQRYEYVDLLCSLYFVRRVREYLAIILCSLPFPCAQYVSLSISFTLDRGLTPTLLDIP